jgi:hypothetical protein
LSTLLPHRRSHLFLLGLLLVDLPVLAAVALAGHWYGYRDTYDGVMDWRLAHPWSLLPSLVLSVWLLRRWWRSGTPRRRSPPRSA